MEKIDRVLVCNGCNSQIKDDPSAWQKVLVFRIPPFLGDTNNDLGLRLQKYQDEREDDEDVVVIKT
jgi:hypothetical protein